MHAKVRRESVAGYAMDETLVCGPRAHKMVAKIYRTPARSIVSVNFEQLLIFTVAKLSVGASTQLILASSLAFLPGESEFPAPARCLRVVIR